MKKLGTALHVIGNKLIVKRGKVKVGKILNAVAMTKGKRKVGRVYDIFGPVNSSYVCIKVFNLKEEELKKLLNKEIYVS